MACGLRRYGVMASGQILHFNYQILHFKQLIREGRTMRFLSQILVSNLLLFLMSSVFADEYRIEAEQSYIHVITSRQGALKRLAHRHVVELGPLEGKVSYEANGNSTAELQLTPEAFFVDRPQTTALYPEIWDKPVNESAA
ncbi:MAG: hypothetical protein P8X74_15625, partial [Reinekea sp.]